jgi:DNA phosphorothioation-dependent restriction protein DptH
MKMSDELVSALSKALANEIIRGKELHAFDVAMGYPEAVQFASSLRANLTSKGPSNVRYDVVLYVPSEKEASLLASIPKELHELCASFGKVVHLREEVARAEENRGNGNDVAKRVLAVIFIDGRISSYGTDVVPSHNVNELFKGIVRGKLEGLAQPQLGLARSIGVERWCSKSSAELPNKRTTAAGVTEFVLKLSDSQQVSQIGRHLYLVGLVPDGRALDGQPGQVLDEVAIKENIQVTAKLGRNALLGLAQRFERAGVRDDDNRVRFRVVSLLERRDGVHENLEDVTKWGPELVKLGDELLFDKWLIHSLVPLPIRELRILPFREADGRVIRKCKLHQDSPNDFDAALYVKVILDNDTGEVKSQGSVNVEWATDPTEVVGIEKWELSIVVPSYLRDPESDSVLAKRKVKGSIRKATIQLSEVDPLLHPSGTRLVVRIRALDEFGNYVEFSDANPRREVDVESDEFEVRYSEELSAPSSSSTENAPSLSFALLDSVINHGFDQPKARLVGFVDSSIVHFSIESEKLSSSSSAKSKVQISRLKYHIRSSEMLAELQLRLLKDSVQTHGFAAAVTSSALLELSDFESKTFALPQKFLEAREEFFKEVLESATPSAESIHSTEPTGSEDSVTQRIDARCLIEFAKWSEEGAPTRVSLALDAYLEAYLEGLRGGCAELLSIDTLEISVSGVDSSHRAAVLMPTHPLRAAWLRDYAMVMFNWQTQLVQLTPPARSRQMDLGLCKRLSPANQPFVISAFDGTDLAWAEEPIFGYGFYMSPATSDEAGRVETTDYEGVAEAMIRALGLTRSEATRQLRVAAVTRAFRSQVESQLTDTRVSIIALNPGSGDLIAGAIKTQRIVDVEDDDEVSLNRQFDVLAYSGFIPFSQPLEQIARLQKQLRSATLRDRLFLLPPLSVTQRPRYRQRGTNVDELLTIDDESAQIAVAHGLVDGVVNVARDVPKRDDYVHGLVSPLVSTQSRMV